MRTGPLLPQTPRGRAPAPRQVLPSRPARQRQTRVLADPLRRPEARRAGQHQERLSSAAQNLGAEAGLLRSESGDLARRLVTMRAQNGMLAASLANMRASLVDQNVALRAEVEALRRENAALRARLGEGDGV